MDETRGEEATGVGVGFQIAGEGEAGGPAELSAFQHKLRRRLGLVSMDLHNNTIGRVSAQDVVLSGFFGSNGLGRPQQPTDAQRQRTAVPRTGGTEG